MCKVLHKEEKIQLKALTESLEKLTGKTIKLESKKDCNCCSTKKDLKEGTWALPETEGQKALAIKSLQNWKDRFYSVLGDDEVFDGIDAAITRIEQLPLKMQESKN